jgi:thiol-disulfide isomerase/thioredoxin
MALAGGLISLACVIGCSRSKPLESAEPISVSVAEIDAPGFEQLRARNRGRALLINFWATWCEPCREEFPELVRVDRAYRDRGLFLAAISVDGPRSAQAIPTFLRSYHAGFAAYHQEPGSLGAVADSINPFWDGGIPASFLYDQQGKLVASWEGTTTFEEFERRIKPLLK